MKNRVDLSGQIIEPPQTSHTTDGNAVCRFVLETVHMGLEKEVTERHDIAAYNRPGGRPWATFAQKQLKVGSQVSLRGSIETPDSPSQENSKEIVVGFLVAGDPPASKAFQAGWMGSVDGRTAGKILDFPNPREGSSIEDFNINEFKEKLQQAVEEKRTFNKALQKGINEFSNDSDLFIHTHNWLEHFRENFQELYGEGDFTETSLDHVLDQLSWLIIDVAAKLAD